MNSRRCCFGVGASDAKSSNKTCIFKYYNVLLQPLNEKEKTKVFSACKMKRHSYMKLFLRATLAVVFIGVSLEAMPQKSQSPLSSDACQQLKTYFVNHINGERKSYDGKHRLKPSQIAEYENIVWDAWKQANALSKEQKLISLGQLDTTAMETWNLPEELEPQAVMPYYYGKKQSGEKMSQLPLFLYTHGSGPKNYEWRTGLLLAQKFDDAPSAYFIPQIPNEGKYYRWWQRSKQWAWEKMLRLALVSGEIDPNRIYVFGISEGGYGSQRLASFYADYWAGAGPMAGGEPLHNAPVENCANIGFSLLTGAVDDGFYRNYFTRATKHAFDSAQAIHPTLFKHRIELIPGKGHHIDYSPTTPWLSRCVRNPYPKHVYWENFEMDSLYRDGFYNIYVRERSNHDFSTRTYYEMDIDGNNININVSEVSYEITQKDPNWDIEMSFVRHYKPAKSGKITLFLNDKLVDLSKKVTICVNGRKVFSGKPRLTLQSMANSCAAFYDPCRIYPAAIDIDIK